MVRYSFAVRLFHPLLPAGLSRRFRTASHLGSEPCILSRDQMPRMARVVAEGVPHPITQRGNNRRATFLQDEDRRYDLRALRDKCRDHGVSVLGYCLMTNHVHLVATPKRADSLTRALGQQIAGSVTSGKRGSRPADLTNRVASIDQKILQL